MPLYQEDLMDLKCTCGMPGCEGSMYFHGQCHPPAPTWVKYFEGVLTVECCECGKAVAQFAIASRAEKDYTNIVVDRDQVHKSLDFLKVVNDVNFLSEEERDNIVAALCDNLGWKRDELPQRLQELEILRKLSEN